MREWLLRHLPSAPQPMHLESAAAPPRLPKTPARNSSNTPHHRASPRHTWNSTWCLLVSFLSRENPQESQPNPTFKPQPGQSTSRPILLALFCLATPFTSLRKKKWFLRKVSRIVFLPQHRSPCAQKFHRTSTCLLACAPSHFPRNYLISSALTPNVQFL